MINNFEQIKKYMPEAKGENFLFLQIVRRNKDNKESHKIHVLYTRFIYSIKELEEIMPMICAICNSMNARAYINLTLKSSEKLQKEVTKILVTNTIDGNRQMPSKVISSVAGKLKGEKNNRYWVLDLDNGGEHALPLNQQKSIKEWTINENIFVDEFPTPNGTHLLVKPFNKLKCYLANLPKFDIHENSAGIILYCPDIL